jgi:hypothetical protein
MALRREEGELTNFNVIETVQRLNQFFLRPASTDRCIKADPDFAALKYKRNRILIILD